MTFIRTGLLLAMLIPSLIYSGEEAPPYSFLNKSDKPNRWSLQLSGQYLYQKGESEGFDIAYAYDNTDIGTRSYSTDGQIFHADLPWKNSARVLAGFSYDQWDLISSWTFYRGNGSKSSQIEVYDLASTNGPVARLISGTWQGFENTNDPYYINTTKKTYFLFSSFNSSYSLNYDCIDLTTGKSLYLNPNFYLRPSIGLRGARVDHQLKISGENRFQSPGNTVFFLDQTVKNRFRGLGIRGALEAKYSVNNYFSLYSELIAALLFGKQKGGISTLTNSGVPANDIFFRTRSPFSALAILPNWQADLGVKFTYPFKNSPALLEIGVGYELTYWPHQWFVNRLYPELIEFAQAGDVSFRALVIDASFAY